jgi:hypothetical protein
MKTSSFVAKAPMLGVPLPLAFYPTRPHERASSGSRAAGVTAARGVASVNFNSYFCKNKFMLPNVHTAFSHHH